MERGALKGGGYWLQGIEDLELGIDPTEFRGEGEFEGGCSTSPETVVVALGWMLQESCP